MDSLDFNSSGRPAMEVHSAADEGSENSTDYNHTEWRWWHKVVGAAIVLAIVILVTAGGRLQVTASRVGDNGGQRRTASRQDQIRGRKRCVLECCVMASLVPELGAVGGEL